MAEGMLDYRPGTLYTEASLPLNASNAATAIVAALVNPFGKNAKIVSLDFFFPEAVTGDNTNSMHLNLMLANGSTEIGQLDFTTGVNATIGTKKAGTLSGTAAQLTIAADGCVTLQREKIGTTPARIAGARVRVGWQRI